jgi:DUF2892 family protein
MNFANEGTWDRGVRMMGGILLLATVGGGLVAAGTLGLVLSVVGFVVLATGLVGWCPELECTSPDFWSACRSVHGVRYRDQNGPCWPLPEL